MTELRLVIDGEPVPASRPRFSSRGGKKRGYTETKYRIYKNGIKILYWDKFHNKQLFKKGVPLIAHIRFYRRIQKGLSKAEYKRRANHEVKPTVKPDLDNLEKAVFDGLEKAWFDDGQIWKHDTEKNYDEHPRTEILIEEWTKDDDNYRNNPS